MSSPRDTILETYGGMVDDTSLSGQLCPRCEGGSSKEKSLSVAKKEGSLLWICHRSSCKFQGRENLIVVSGGLRNFGPGPEVTPKLTFTCRPSFYDYVFVVLNSRLKRLMPQSNQALDL